MKKTIVLIPCFVLIVSINLKAQNNVVAGGGNATGTGGTASYSLGQINYMPISGSGGTSNLGLQQPYGIFPSDIEATSIPLAVNVHPNPAADVIILSFKDAEWNGVSYALTDVQGKMITRDELKKEETAISMVTLNNGIYFIKLMCESKELRSFKIIKNK